MKIRLEASDPLQATTDALVISAAAGESGVQWSASANAVNKALSGELETLAADARFTGRSSATLVVPTLGRLPARRVVLAGVGPQERFDQDAYTRAVGAALRAAREYGAKSASVALPDPAWSLALGLAIEGAVLGASLGQYQFESYRGSASSESAMKKELSDVVVHSGEIAEDEAQHALQRGVAVARAVNLARDLGNEPASVLNPETLAARAREIAEVSGLEIEILGPEALAEIGAEATLAVGSGSAVGPRMIRLSYQPASGSTGNRTVGLVGKAITFDTGGYSIKPYEGMLDMKGDMSGGAAVLGTMSALRDLQCPVPVEATICAAENMISGTAFRPGDVLRGMNGVTMEILSTDAEGRLVLADGLIDTARRRATELIDLATLTGAAIVALGNGTTALFASDDELAEKLQQAAESTGERMWRMPLTEELESKIKGDVADIKNTGGRAGGAITAALFLQHFTEGLPWAHLDIAGPARQTKAGPLGPKGSTGVGVRTLLRYLTS